MLLGVVFTFFFFPLLTFFKDEFDSSCFIIVLWCL